MTVRSLRSLIREGRRLLSQEDDAEPVEDDEELDLSKKLKKYAVDSQDGREDDEDDVAELLQKLKQRYGDGDEQIEDPALKQPAQKRRLLNPNRTPSAVGWLGDR